MDTDPHAITRRGMAEYIAMERLDRVEGKLDDIRDQLSAFPVVGQRIADIERRLLQVEGDIRALEKSGNDNAMGIAKIGGIFTVLGVLGAVIAQQIIEL